MIAQAVAGMQRSEFSKRRVDLNYTGWIGEADMSQESYSPLVDTNVRQHRLRCLGTSQLLLQIIAYIRMRK